MSNKASVFTSIVSDSHPSKKEQYTLHSGNCFHSIHLSLKNAKAEALTLPMPSRITKQHYHDSEWLAVVHYIVDPRRGKLQALKEQRQALSNEIEQLEKELEVGSK